MANLLKTLPSIAREEYGESPDPDDWKRSMWKAIRALQELLKRP
jgi:hypothetical protein